MLRSVLTARCQFQEEELKRGVPADIQQKFSFLLCSFHWLEFGVAKAHPRSYKRTKEILYSMLSCTTESDFHSLLARLKQTCPGTYKYVNDRQREWHRLFGPWVRGKGVFTAGRKSTAAESCVQMFRCVRCSVRCTPSSVEPVVQDPHQRRADAFA